MKIHVLDESVYAKIAAGEVIDRPAAIVRELIDNSIDAGATSIEIRLTDGGISGIMLTDNGDGMDREDLEMSTLKHSTSKITNIEDLFKIQTMGFRGEALYSIRTVSHLKITTNTSQAGTTPGYSLTFNENAPVIEQCAFRKGTRIEVNDLFYNLPARRKFLKSKTTELNSIKQVIIDKIFARLSTGFSLYNDDKLIFRTSGDGLFENAFHAVYKTETTGSLQHYALKYSESLSIEVYHSSREHFFSHRKYQVLYVNGRPVSLPFFYPAISQGYSDYISPGRHPVVYCYITVDPSQIDINIHPAKREIRFYDQQSVFSALTLAVKGAYSHEVKSSLITPDTTPGNIFFVNEKTDPFHKSNGGFQNNFKQLSRPDTPLTEEGSLLQLYENHKAAIAENTSNIPMALQIETGDIQIIGTVFSTYLTVVRNDTLYFIDQHALEESYIYRLKKNAYLENPSIDHLLIPLILEPEVSNEYLSQRLNILLDNGILAEEIEGGSYMIKSLPSVLNAMSTEDIKITLTDWLNENTPAETTLIDDLLIRSSCREAIKKGDILSPLEIRNLVDIFFRENITNCPHGRPVFFEISKTLFEKNFQRKK